MKAALSPVAPLPVPRPASSAQPWRHTLPAARTRARGEAPRFRSAFEILRSLDLFAAVTDGELIKFAALGQERRVERDHLVAATPGRGHQPLALILEGDAVLSCDRGPEELFLRALEPGDLVGEIELFVSLPRAFAAPGHDGMLVRERAGAYGAAGSGEGAGRDGTERCGEATARATSTVRLIEWDRDAVREALRRWPDVALGLLGSLARRQREMQRRVTGLCGHRAPRRLARALSALLEERGVTFQDDTGRGMLLPRTPSRARLAEIAGMARETVSRLLAEWERHGWIGTRAGDLLVRDPLPLRRLAGEAP